MTQQLVQRKHSILDFNFVEPRVCAGTMYSTGTMDFLRTKKTLNEAVVVARFFSNSNRSTQGVNHWVGPNVRGYPYFTLAF